MGKTESDVRYDDKDGMASVAWGASVLALWAASTDATGDELEATAEKVAEMSSMDEEQRKAFLDIVKEEIDVP